MSEKTSIVNSFSTHLRNAIAKALDLGRKLGHKEISILHLLFGLAGEKGSLSSEMLSNTKLPLDLLKQEIAKQFSMKSSKKNVLIPQLNDDIVTILTKAVRTAQLYRHTYVGTEHALACLLNFSNEQLNQLFAVWQIDINELKRQLLVVLKSTSKFPDLSYTLRQLQSEQDDSIADYSDLPVLETLGKELTTPEFIKSCPPLIGRDKEVERLQQILSRHYKNNPILIGNPGVGKTAIAEGLAQAIITGRCRPNLCNKRIFSLELSSLVAGTMYRGDFEQRLKTLIEELKNQPDIILFIDEIHTLIGAGSTGQPLDAANILKPALARGEIRCIGATTWNEYQKHINQDHALARRFQIIPVHEPNMEQTKEIIEGVKPVFEKFHHVKISKQAVESALELADRYITHTCFPDKALDLLDEAAAQITLEKPANPNLKRKETIKNQITNLQKTKQEYLHQDQYQQALEIHGKIEKLLIQLNKISALKISPTRLTDQHIRQAVATRTGINTDRLHLGAEPITDNLFHDLKQTIIGQDQALESIAKAVQRGYSLLKEPHKPCGTFLFLGPSGVGKTATAKALAKYLFTDEQALIRLDMSEFAERFTMSKLIGAPAGYVGYQESGQLTNAVRQRPLSVVLFDEIEKAHPDIFNLLLQIMDEGRLSDGKGDIVDFRHTVIILTSNLGLKELQHKIGFFDQDKRQNLNQNDNQEIKSAVKDFFRLEILNRLDDIIYFQSLGIEPRQAIIEQKLGLLKKRLQNHVELNFADEIKKFLAEQQYQTQEGVRSLEKTIREHIEIPLTNNLFKYKKGAKVKLDIENKNIIFQ